MFPDNVAVLAVDANDPFTFHLEIQLDYTPDTPNRIARHGIRLILRPANPDSLIHHPRLSAFIRG